MIHAGTAQYCLEYRHNNVDTRSIMYASVLYMMKAIAIGKTYNGDIRIHIQRALKKNGVKIDLAREIVTNTLYIKELSILSLHGEFLIGGIPVSFMYRGQEFFLDIFSLYRIGDSLGGIIFDPFIQHVNDSNMLLHSLPAACFSKWAEEQRLKLDFIEYLTLRGTTSTDSRPMERRNMTTNVADTNIIRNPVINYNILDSFVSLNKGEIRSVHQCNNCKLLGDCWDVKNRQF